MKTSETFFPFVERGHARPFDDPLTFLTQSRRKPLISPAPLLARIGRLQYVPAWEAITVQPP